MEEENKIKEELEHLTSLYLFEEINSEEKKRLFSILDSSPIYKAEFSELQALHKTLLKENLDNIIVFPTNRKKQTIKKRITIAAIAAMLLFGILVQRKFKEEVENFITIQTQKEYGQCHLKNEKDKITYSSEKYSICEVILKTKNIYHILLYPETKLEAKGERNSFIIHSFSGNMILDSKKDSKEEALQIQLEQTKIDFYGTRIKLDWNTEKKITVLEGSVGIKKDLEPGILITNKGERISWDKQALAVKKETLSKQEFESIENLYKKIQEDSNLSSSKINAEIAEEILHKPEKALPKILGKRLVLKNGKSILANSIFQKDSIYLIFTDKEVLSLEKVEVESIEFE